MNVFPLEFIDSKWFDETRNEIQSVRKMYENIINYVKKLEDYIERNENDIKTINDTIEAKALKADNEMHLLNENVLKAIKEIENIKAEFAKQHELFEEYASVHEAQHNEHVGLLDRIFKK